MKRVGAYEAKTHLPKLLELVRQGESITITKHGVVVAILQPPNLVIKKNPKETIAALKAFRSRHRLDGISLKDMIDEGRR